MTDEEAREFERIKKKLAYYEEEVPMGKGNCYHKFTDEGICIRCYEDAEEWDAGCVEETVEELKSLVHPEFVGALEQIAKHRYTHVELSILRQYMPLFRRISKSFNWEVADGGSDSTLADGAVQRPAGDTLAL